MEATKIVRLTLDVAFRPNGESDDYLMDLLRELVRRGMDAGVISGQGNAEVDAHQYTVQIVDPTRTLILPTSQPWPHGGDVPFERPTVVTVSTQDSKTYTLPPAYVWVVAFQPAPDRGSVGGHDWFYRVDVAGRRYRQIADDSAHDNDTILFFRLDLTMCSGRDKASINGFVEGYALDFEYLLKRRDPYVVLLSHRPAKEPVYPEEVMDPPWSRKHHKAAIAEGWNIFTCEGSMYGKWQLDKFDEPADWAVRNGGVVPPDLVEDELAWLIVTHGNGEHHKAALAFLKAHNPGEYERVMKLSGQFKGRYTVDGHEFPTESEINESPLQSDGKYPPFRVFDSQEQTYLGATFDKWVDAVIWMYWHAEASSTPSRIPYAGDGGVPDRQDLPIEPADDAVPDYVVMTGNPKDGFKVHGPFSIMEAANEWADHNVAREFDWWVMPLQAVK